MFRGISIVAGVIMIIGGFYCLLTPAATYLSLAPLAGIFMVVDAVGEIVTWFQNRKLGLSRPWMLIAAVLSLALGVVMLGSAAMQVAFDLMIAYMIAIWVVLAGCFRITVAIDMHRIRKQTGLGTGAWVLVLILGILMIAAGIFGFVNPSFVVVAVGMVIGFAIISTGASLVSLAFV